MNATNHSRISLERTFMDNSCGIRDFKQKDTGDKYSTSSKKVLQTKNRL